MQAMAKLHSYYVTNAATEMSYAYTDLTPSEFCKALSESFNEFTDFSDEEIQDQEYELDFECDDNDLTEDESESVTPESGSEIIMENYFNFNDEDLQKALVMDVRVVIEQQEITNYDHRENNYDINALLDANFNKNDGNQNEE
jgi:hypothetical protein